VNLAKCNIHYFYFLDLSRALGPKQYCHNTSVQSKSVDGLTRTVVPIQFAIDQNQMGNDLLYNKGLFIFFDIDRLK